MAVLSGRNFVLAAAFAGLFAAMPASADVNTDANALFVGVVQAWTAAAAIPADDPTGAAERAELLETVNRDLDQIINDLPGSDLAVRLNTGETLGPITLQGARDALAQTNAAASGLECAAAPSPACLVQEALPDLAMIDDRMSLILAMTGLFRPIIMSDDIDGALALMAEYPNIMSSEVYQSSIAQANARLGQDDVARALINQPEMEFGGQIIMAGIAKGQAEAGRFTDAAATAAQITDPLQRLIALAAARQFTEALAQLDLIPIDQEPTAINQLAVAMARAGQIGPATALVSEVSIGAFRIQMIAEISLAQARVGQIDEAIGTAQSLEFPDAIELLLALWYASPDPRIVVDLQARFDSTPPDARGRRLILVAMSIVSSDPAYAAEAEAILNASPDERTRQQLQSFDATFQVAAGRYAQASALAIALPHADPGAAMIRIDAIGYIAQAMAADPRMNTPANP